jgi:hypothetical protein
MGVKVGNVSAIRDGHGIAAFGRKADFSVFGYSCEAHCLLQC